MLSKAEVLILAIEYRVLREENPKTTSDQALTTVINNKLKTISERVEGRQQVIDLLLKESITQRKIPTRSRGTMVTVGVIHANGRGRALSHWMDGRDNY